MVCPPPRTLDWKQRERWEGDLHEVLLAPLGHASGKGRGWTQPLIKKGVEARGTLTTGQAPRATACLVLDVCAVERDAPSSCRNGLQG